VTALIENEPLIYERADGVVYARYRDRPEIPRWIIGGDPDGVARAKGEVLSIQGWKDLCDLAGKYPTLKMQLDKTIELYYIIKDDK